MFRLYADKNKLTLLEREPVTSGSVNVYEARFEFSEDWEGLERVAVFWAAGPTVEVLLGPDAECEVPWEALQKPGYTLRAGVYGKDSAGTVVLPTVRASLGTILEGVPTNGEGARPPTPDLWEQELARKGDRLDYTEAGELGLYSGDKLLSSVLVSGGGGGGTSDHRALSHRGDENQHPIEAISGLDEIPNKRVLEIWNGGINL